MAYLVIRKTLVFIIDTVSNYPKVPINSRIPFADKYLSNMVPSKELLS